MFFIRENDLRTLLIKMESQKKNISLIMVQCMVVQFLIVAHTVDDMWGNLLESNDKKVFIYEN